MGEVAKPEWAEVGRRLKWVELAEGKNATQIANDLGIDWRSWSKYKAGKRELPIWLAAELRRLYGVGLEWLFLDEEHRNSEEFRRRLAEARTKLNGSKRHRPASVRGRRRTDEP